MCLEAPLCWHDRAEDMSRQQHVRGREFKRRLRGGGGEENSPPLQRLSKLFGRRYV